MQGIYPRVGFIKPIGQRFVEVRGQKIDEDSVPVSYTHLRAHETVLDLVCRLLLEKKKTPIAYVSGNCLTDRAKRDIRV